MCIYLSYAFNCTKLVTAYCTFVTMKLCVKLLLKLQSSGGL